ncbi:hypothetical protein FQR65_LT08851 [Abscondita terminalis]|nr:hypothetical protein FQR65_LT08851 [Abscondita terminalis]
MVSAGLVYAVTRNCSKGLLKGCGCTSKFRGSSPKNMLKSNDKGRKTQWSWGGCSDDIEFGQSVAKNILDDLEIGSDPQTYANLHNNYVGRTIVRNTMVRKCRCHGVSGSCSLQTCWMQVAPFNKIADVIRQRYKKAVRTNIQNRINSFEVSSPLASKRIEDIRTHQLVYFEQSPDYCLADTLSGWPGTKGRSCSRSHSKTATLQERKSCRHLCRNCGHRVRKHKRQIKRNCNCSFKWCCEVKCDVCTETVEEFHCD